MGLIWKRVWRRGAKTRAEERSDNELEMGGGESTVDVETRATGER